MAGPRQPLPSQRRVIVLYRVAIVGPTLSLTAANLRLSGEKLRLREDRGPRAPRSGVNVFHHAQFIVPPAQGYLRAVPSSGAFSDRRSPADPVPPPL